MIVMTGEECPAVKAYIERCLRTKLSDPCIVLGFVTSDRSRPLCAVLLNSYTGANIDLSVVAEPGGATLGVIRYLCDYVFVQLGCRRLTVRTRKRNKLVQKMARRCGFTFEAVAKHHYHDDDAVVFRMLKHECKWLKVKNNGFTISAHAA